MSDDRQRPSSNEVEVQTFKALPRDPNQAEHRKPRAFIHRPAEATDPDAVDAPPPSIVDAARTVQLEDFTKVHQTPCVRNALLPGIGGGMAIGAGRFVIGASILTACNWASASFVGISVVAYQYCQRRRTLEKDGIRKAVQVLDQKQALKDAEQKAMASGQAPPVPPTRSQIAGGVSGPVAAHKDLSSGNEHNVPFWSSFKFW